MEQLPEKPKQEWRNFRRLRFDSKAFSKRARKAETSTTKHAHKFILKRMDSLRESRRAILTWMGMVGVILLATAAQAFIYGGEATTEAASDAGTYAEGVIGKLETLNPLYASSAPEIAASRLVFSSLYKYDRSGTLRPDLALNTEVDSEGRNYTVKLRSDALWHDGQKLTADDVVFTIETIKNPAARVRSSLHVNWRDIAVKKIDDTTVQFTLPPYAAFAHALTFPVVPKHLVAAIAPGALYESSFSRSPVGSGPFQYRLLQAPDSTSRQKVFHMTANEHYYDGAPRLSRFEIHAYATEDDLVRAVNTAEVTGAADITSGKLSDITSPAYETRHYAIDNGVYAMMNTTKPPLDSREVRQAIQAVIDTKKLRELVGGEVQPLDLPFLRTNLSSIDDITLPKVDKAHAEKLLGEAGWAMGKDKVRAKESVPLRLTITTTKNSQYEAVAKYIAEQLASIGFKAEVLVIDDKAPGANFIQGTLQARNFDMLVYELPIGADPDVYAYWHSSQIGMSGYNFSNYKSGAADAALSSARDRLDVNLRRAKYVTFANEWLKDAPAIGLYQQTMSYAVNKNAEVMGKGSTLVLSSDRYMNVHDWTVNRTRVYKTP